MAAGDITLTSSVTQTITGFTVLGFNVRLDSGTMTIDFREAATGAARSVVVTDTACIGFDVAGGVITDRVPRSVSGEFTKLLGILFGAATGNANARRTAAVQALKDDGVITLTGTVG